MNYINFIKCCRNDPPRPHIPHLVLNRQGVYEIDNVNFEEMNEQMKKDAERIRSVLKVLITEFNDSHPGHYITVNSHIFQQEIQTRVGTMPGGKSIEIQVSVNVDL